MMRIYTLLVYTAEEHNKPDRCHSPLNQPFIRETNEQRYKQSACSCHLLENIWTTFWYNNNIL